MNESVHGKIPAVAVDMVARLGAAWNSGDAADLAALYGPNASYCSPPTGLLLGRAVIQAAMQESMNAGRMTIKEEALLGELHGDQGYVVTSYQFFGPTNRLIGAGYALHIVVRESGTWQVTCTWVMGEPPRRINGSGTFG